MRVRDRTSVDIEKFVNDNLGELLLKKIKILRSDNVMKK
jgi:hypothetical protein